MLAARTRQIFCDWHAWSGVVLALPLYVMFFMAPFGLFSAEIDLWAEPGHAAPGTIGTPPLRPLLEQLEREGGITGADRVEFMPGRTGLRAHVSQGGEHFEYRYVPERGRLEPVRSGLGSFLFSMHYLGPLPRGVWLAGFCAMALLLAIASGVPIVARDLGRQLFRFRPERRMLIVSLDLHKVLGVFGLPFQVLYAWTGAVLCLGYLVVQPMFLRSVFGGDPQAMALARGASSVPEAEPSGRLGAPLPDLDALVRVAGERIPALNPTSIGIEQVGDEASLVRLRGDIEGGAFESAEVVLRARDGAVASVRGPGEANAYHRFDAWFRGLHYARFGGDALKLVYCLLAFATCAVIVTGNLIWLERRDPRRSHLGNRILRRLTTGVCAGVLFATAAAFLANRLLPAALPQRTGVEQASFWSAWAIALLLPFAWRQARRVAGLELLLAGALWSSVVLIDVATRTGALEGVPERSVLLGLSLLAAGSLVGGARLLMNRQDAKDAKFRTESIQHF